MAVASATVTRWIKKCMLNVGIDTSVYSVHSIRAASSTTAVAFGTPVKKVMAKADWKNVDTFVKTCFRPNLTDSSSKCKHQNSGITAGFKKLTPHSILSKDEHVILKKKLRKFKDRGHISDFWSKQSVQTTLGHKLMKGNLVHDDSSVTTENTSYKKPKEVHDSIIELKTSTESVIDSDGLTKVSDESKSNFTEHTNIKKPAVDSKSVKSVSTIKSVSAVSLNQ